MMVNLITFNRKGARKDISLGANPLVIGRKAEADIRIPVGEVSRSHCELRLQGDKVLVRDLGSSNGTFVNDQKVTETTLKAGDMVRVGPVQFTVQIDGKPDKVGPPTAAAKPPAAAQPAAKSAASDEATRVGPSKSPAKPSVDEDFDIDALEELDADDLSDFDIDDISDSGIIEDVEEVSDLEEISEDDLIPDDDSDKI